ncbi:MarR family transcriptional regulator [Neobacillus sp. MM2021_6]|uniref:MarR family winged helix-turn-helix transcriptional regulator n=1 Tax=Bacillaceae TaxID=186817 RepID=UPI00140B0A0A|nr:MULTISPECIES: MarR family transcriptional regulator [Bacillaceae]MBO0960604.1 MarR family transcriptional regulator [Neobacillus sp. MM2021_6]NHC18610.1 MarR family transcriptional regulator [Bacillus sp. MM2020_4]WML39862.1 MarR family transcriptional regulator [Neobacillus sp. OS1-2]
MADFESGTAQKLLQSFMQLKKTGWHNKKIAGFNPSEFRVLATIQRFANDKNSEMKVSEISQLLEVTPPTITQIVNILEKDSLVERTVDPDDRRAVKITLTPAGMEATKNARKAFGETFLGLIDYLGEEESVQLAELLTKVHDYFTRVSNQ